MPAVAEPGVRVLIAPFKNATNDENAGIALEQITASALVARGARALQAGQPNGAGEPGTGLPMDRSEDASVMVDEVAADYLLFGVVHEHRYKTDLDGDPAVGLTLRLVDPDTQATVWQGTGSDVGLLRASLTSVSQKVAGDLVAQMPLHAVVEPPTGD
ncbi:MAG: hypothetical protein ACLFS1_02875 [Opitutales bacterium]